MALPHVKRNVTHTTRPSSTFRGGSGKKSQQEGWDMQWCDEVESNHWLPDFSYYGTCRTNSNVLMITKYCWFAYWVRWRTSNFCQQDFWYFTLNIYETNTALPNLCTQDYSGSKWSQHTSVQTLIYIIRKYCSRCTSSYRSNHFRQPLERLQWEQIRSQHISLQIYIYKLLQVFMLKGCNC